MKAARYQQKLDFREEPVNPVCAMSVAELRAIMEQAWETNNTKLLRDLIRATYADAEVQEWVTIIRDLLGLKSLELMKRAIELGLTTDEDERNSWLIGRGSARESGDPGSRNLNREFGGLEHRDYLNGHRRSLYLHRLEQIMRKGIKPSSLSLVTSGQESISTAIETTIQSTEGGIFKKHQHFQPQFDQKDFRRLRKNSA